MGLITIPIAETVDLNHGTKTVILPYPLIRGDDEAHEIILTLKSGGNSVALTGATVNCYAVLSDTVSTAIASGTVSGNVVRATLNEGFYSQNGRIDMFMRLSLSGVIVVPLRILANVQGGITDTIIDADDVVPSLDELLSQISAMEALEDDIETAEASRVSAETGRVNAETARVGAETTRGSNESTRQSNEQTRQTKEGQRQSAETGRVTSEEMRVSNETTRQGNENTRQSNESTRQTNENSRSSAETTRSNAETTRGNNELTRQSNESTRQTQEAARVLTESGRSSAETSRRAAEETRQIEETTRQQNELTRQEESAKLSGMTVSESSVDYGTTPQATLTEENGVKHLALQVERGPQGASYTILGSAYATLAELEADISGPAVGDQYNVGSSAPYAVYRWTGDEWENQGTIQGEKGDPFVYSDFTAEQIAALKGETGATFTPAVSNAGVLSWTNDGGLTNPEAVDVAALVAAAVAAERQLKRLTFADVSVAASAWTDTDQTAGTVDAEQYDSGYTKKAAISCTGVTADMYADVVFAPDERNGGNYSGNASSGSGTVTIYAKEAPTEAITIPTIIVWP